MSKQNKRSISKSSTILAGSVGSVLLGWLLNKYGKAPAKRAYAGINQKVKDTQNKWYTDGEKRANDLKQIKHEVESRL